MVGIKGRDMGFGIVSNVAKFGFSRAFTPLIQIGGANFFTVIGKVERKLSVVTNDGNSELAIRDILPLSITYDTRLACFP